MSLNFKVDSRDRVWMLWSNSIRLASDMLPGRETFTHVQSPLNIGDLVRLYLHHAISFGNAIPCQRELLVV